MRKEIITFTDYNGVERTEEFHFNLNHAELTELETSVEGGMTDMMKGLVASENQEGLIKILKTIIFKAYGVKSEDGRRFIKSEELSREFSQTEAYPMLFMKLATDDKYTAEFVKGIMPKDLRGATN